MTFDREQCGNSTTRDGKKNNGGLNFRELMCETGDGTNVLLTCQTLYLCVLQLQTFCTFYLMMAAHSPVARLIMEDTRFGWMSCIFKQIIS